MISRDSGTARRWQAVPPGAGLGALGVLAFSLTLPLTEIVVRTVSPYLAASARATVAALIAVVYLRLRQARAPRGREWGSLAVIALGIVLGFPLATAVALRHGHAGHGAVIVGLLPAATATIAVVRGRERPSRAFWIAGGLGAVLVAGYAAATADGAPTRADLLMLVAVAAAAIGYAEGARLTPILGAGETVGWALVLAAPPMAVATAWLLRHGLPSLPPRALGAFAYTACVSMFLGFLPWFRGLARGGTARISQIQLLQPSLTVASAAVLLGEPIAVATPVVVVAVAACVLIALRARFAAVPA